MSTEGSWYRPEEGPVRPDHHYSDYQPFAPSLLPSLVSVDAPKSHCIYSFTIPQCSHIPLVKQASHTLEISKFQTITIFQTSLFPNYFQTKDTWFPILFRSKISNFSNFFPKCPNYELFCWSFSQVRHVFVWEPWLQLHRNPDYNCVGTLTTIDKVSCLNHRLSIVGRDSIHLHFDTIY